MAKRSRSTEVKAGLAVLAGLVILVLGLFLVSGGREALSEKSRYSILFENAGGVVKGDNVYVAGQKAGEVAVVETKRFKRDGVERIYVWVTIEIGADFQIPIDSRFSIHKTITNLVTFQVDYGTDKKLATEQTRFFGQRLRTFEEVVDQTFALVDEVQEGVRAFNTLMAKLNEEVDALDIAGLRQEAGRTLASVGRSVALVERMLTRAEAPVDRVLSNIDEASGTIVRVARRAEKDWPRIERKIETALDRATELQGDLRDLVSENRPAIKSAFQRLDDALRRLAPLLASVEGVSKEARDTLIEIRPELVKAFSSAADAMENFKETTEDLKTAPWKLINKPSDRESDDIHFYNAARLYLDSAQKIGDVIRDIETLRRLGAMDDPEQAALVAKTLTVLQQSLTKYQENQERLARLMIERERGAAAK